MEGTTAYFIMNETAYDLFLGLERTDDVCYRTIPYLLRDSDYTETAGDGGMEVKSGELGRSLRRLSVDVQCP